MQNNTSHLKYLVVAKEMSWVIFCFVFFWQKGDIILILLTVDILGICCRWVFCKLHRFDKSPYQWWIVVNNIFNWFCFVLSCKMDDVMFRLLIVFFLVMFFKLVFCKLENMRWPSNNLKHLTEVLRSKWLNGTQYKWHLTKLTSHNLHYCQESWSGPE